MFFSLRFLLDVDEKKKIEEGENRENFAVLKICHNYSIECHEILAKLNLAPKIIGYEKFSNNCFVILMEYFECNYGEYYSLFYHILELKESKSSLNPLKNALKLLLDEMKSKGIVHGDFRSNNIIIKYKKGKDQDKGRDEYEISDFKLIDFEYSGKESSCYPCLSLKNQEINWPQGFNSYWPRSFEHDKFMLEEMFK